MKTEILLYTLLFVALVQSVLVICRFNEIQIWIDDMTRRRCQTGCAKKFNAGFPRKFFVAHRDDGLMSSDKKLLKIDGCCCDCG